MLLIGQLLQTKHRDVFSVPPEASVLEAIKLMGRKGVGALLVMRDAGLVGLISERDYARKVILAGRAPDATPVSDIMTPEPVTACSGDTVDQCLDLMTRCRTRHLPVVDDGKLRGVISMGDLVAAIVEDRQAGCEALELLG